MSTRRSSHIRRRGPVRALTVAVLATLALAIGPRPMAAAEPARLQQATDPALPVLGPAWRLPNPYRGEAAVLAAGQAAYRQHCAQCHGEDARTAVPEGPDLRRLNSTCQRLKDSSLRPLCLQDVDAYYLQSVREGKRRAGQMHMPAWEGVLSQETLWAIRSFTETQPLPPRRTLPDLPPGGARVR